MTNENGTDDRSGRSYQYSDEELKDALRKVYSRHGKVTIELYNDHDEHDLPASSVIIERFGGWVDAKKAAGVGGDERASNARPRVYDDEELIEMMQECERRYGAVVQSEFDIDDDFCASGTVVKRFGSWSEAKREAGVQ